MRVVEAGELDVEPADRQPAAGVGEVQPAGGVEAVTELLPRVVDGAADAASPAAVRVVEAVDAAAQGGEVAGRVLAGGPVVVVGAEDVDAGELHQRPERVEGGGHTVRVGEVVAGVHDEVGPEPGEALEPALLLLLPGHHVDVGDLQDPDGPGPLGQDWYVDPAQPERADLVPGGVGEAGGAGGGDSEGDGVQRSHRSMLSDGGSAAERAGGPVRIRRASGGPGGACPGRRDGWMAGAGRLFRGGPSAQVRDSGHDDAQGAAA